MSQFNLYKAVHWNPYYARKTGWRKRYGQVMNALGFNNMCPGEELFAWAVYKWQQRHPSLKTDGMLGPQHVAPVGAGNAIQH